MSNPLKVAFRNKIKTDVLARVPPESRRRQSEAITKHVIESDAFRNARTISVYLSTSSEVDTTGLLDEMFKQGKQVFVPTYNKNVMEMVKLKDMQDYDTLPLSKWNIKQPKITDERENALNTTGIDLFLTPGVAFTLTGNRLGHGMGFYDKYFKRYFDTFPERLINHTTVLMALALKEQIVTEKQLPIDQNDVKLDHIVTEDGIFPKK